ncbi:hypothetical protein LZ30DRAFT_701075 [Colletotrichum cereale]|nr:hypothetical protein LZ30DRAFT_701075 [Colletotrichum cereale]
MSSRDSPSPLGRGGPEPSGLPRSFVTCHLSCVCVFLFLHARPIRAQPPLPLRCRAPGGLDLQCSTLMGAGCVHRVRVCVWA